MRFDPLQMGNNLTLGARTFTPLPVNHVVPACAIQMRAAGNSLVFSGDTTQQRCFHRRAQRHPRLAPPHHRNLVRKRAADIAQASKHHWPDSLATALQDLRVRPQVWITHLKPGNEAAIMDELRAAAPDWTLTALQQGQVIFV